MAILVAISWQHNFLPMGFLDDLLSGHEAFFASSDAEKGLNLPKESSNREVTEEEKL